MQEAKNRAKTRGQLRWLLFILLLAGLAVTFAMQTVQPSDDGRVNIADSGRWIHDPSGDLTPEQALTQAETMPADAVGGHVAIDGQGYWLVADLDNYTTTGQWAVNLYVGRYERAVLTVFDDGRAVQQFETGLIDVANQPEPSLIPGYTLPFDFPPSTKRTIVLRLESAHMANVAIDAGPRAALEGSMVVRSVVLLLGFGGILALIGYNLFLGVALRDWAYLFYILHATGYSIYLFTIFGYSGSLFGITHHTWSLFVAAGLIQTFAALFVYRVLDVPRHAPFLRRFFLGYFAFLALNVVGAPIFGFYSAMAVGRLTALLMPILIFSAAIQAWRSGSSQAPYIVAGWLPLFAVSSIGNLAMSGEMTQPPFIALVSLGAVVFEMLLLSLALADRVRQLRVEKLFAEETNEAKSAFLATMSHEVRTPLNGILGTLELLRRTMLSDQQRRYVDTIRTSGSALLELLNNVLDYATVEAGKIVVREEEYAPTALIKSIVDLNMSRAQANGVNLSFTVDPAAVGPVTGDAALLRQVLLNLVGNAVKFTDRGRVIVRLTKCADDILCFEVEDTGPGIPASALPTLFDRFTRVTDERSSRHEGTGLGLAIAKEMVEAMGGSIGVETVEGSGSRFFFRVPFGKTVPEAVASNPDAGNTGAFRVLIVDDTKINRDILSDYLTQEGYNVEVAVSGIDALNKFTAGAFDVILMDLFMPETDGAETTRKILAIDPDIVVIGITAANGIEQRADCVRAGMRDVLAKPLDFELLLSVLKRQERERITRHIGPVLLNRDVLLRNESILGRTKACNIIGDFHRYSTSLVDEIRDAIDQGDNDRIEAAAHRLTGVAGVVGLEALAALAAEVCEAATQGKDAPKKSGEALLSMYQNSLKALAEYGA
jgi:signal transduction histidine kinase/ActR/RegA family two-component response regulator